jgi:transcriptional regulator with XRE-family HTH domain
MESTTLLGRFVSTRRQEQHLSLSELAKRTGVNKTTIHRLETGESRPTADLLSSLARALGLPAVDLFVLAGYLNPHDLPSLRVYLQAAYGDLPPQTLTEIEACLQRGIHYPGS